MQSIDKLFRDYERMVKRLAAEEAASKRVIQKRKSRNKCGAHARSTGKPCQMKPLANGRCRLHGGLSTGPKTEEGKERAKANLKQFRP
jgi:hypothetical protein